MKTKQTIANIKTTESPKLWQKTSSANLIRYTPSGMYFCRIRVQGRLIRKSLKTDVLSVAKLRLTDEEKRHRQLAQRQMAIQRGRGQMTFGDALKIYRARLQVNPDIKTKTKDYYSQRVDSLLATWAGLEKTNVRDISKQNCLDWAARYEGSSTAFNNTALVLRAVLDIAIESGVIYENVARHVTRRVVRPKELDLPDNGKFAEFVQVIENGGGRFSRDCADLVRFLAYGGFRLGEAKNITWSDCDFTREEIIVSGDPDEGTKNSEIRRVPIIAEMRELLERLRQERPDEPADARVMRVTQSELAMKAAEKKAGIAHLTHHDLRHLFATRCIESGVDIPTVSRWLGHKDGGALAMKVYGHLRDEHSIEMAQKVSFKKSLELHAKTAYNPRNMEWHFIANTPSELANIDHTIFPPEKNQNRLDEQVQMARLLQVLVDASDFQFPVCVRHTPKAVPDFQLRAGDKRIAVELTKIAVQDVEHARALQRVEIKQTLTSSNLIREQPEPRSKNEVISEGFLNRTFVYPPGIEERDRIWIDHVKSSLDSKSTVLARADFIHGQEDWLLLWNLLRTAEWQIEARQKVLANLLLAYWKPDWFSRVFVQDEHFFWHMEFTPTNCRILRKIGSRT